MRTDINNAERLRDSKLRVMHIRGRAGGEGRDITVAYRPPTYAGHNIEVATAITNPNDVFTKKIGTKQAIENFLAGHTIMVPDQDRVGPTVALTNMFG